MIVIKTLPTGRTVRRDVLNRVWLHEADGALMGEVIRGGTTALLLGLTDADFGDLPHSSSPGIVAGPEGQPKRGPQRLIDRYRAAVAAWRAGR